MPFSKFWFKPTIYGVFWLPIYNEVEAAHKVLLTQVAYKYYHSLIVHSTHMNWVRDYLFVDSHWVPEICHYWWSTAKHKGWCVPLWPKSELSTTKLDKLFIWWHEYGKMTEEIIQACFFLNLGIHSISQPQVKSRFEMEQFCGLEIAFLCYQYGDGLAYNLIVLFSWSCVMRAQ